MPPGTVYVGRSSRWGNGWRVGDSWYDAEKLETVVIADTATAVRAYQQDVGLLLAAELAEWIGPLRGKDLACWCALDQPCHADVLLELAA